jgi:hypothetical protein
MWGLATICLFIFCLPFDFFLFVAKGKSTSEFQRVPAGGSGNRTVIIGSSNLHCQPPAMEMEFPPNTYGDCLISFLFYYPVLSEFCSLGGVGGGLKYANIFESANKTNCGLCVVVVVIRCTSHVERGGGT